MISRLGLRLGAIFERTAPDPFSLAVLLSVVTLGLALGFGTFPIAGTSDDPASIGWRATALLDSWRAGDGLWKFLGFSMQMSLILVTGHALASSGTVARVIARIASMPRSNAQGAAMVGLVAAATGLINWGLGLIAGALLAREVGRALTSRGVRVHYPLIVAAGYMGLLVWHGGLSGSAPLKSTTGAELASILPADAFAAIGSKAVAPLDQTVGSWLNVFVSGGLLLVIPAMLWMLSPKDPSRCRPMPALPDPDPHPREPEPDDPRPIPLAQRLGTTPWLSMVLAAWLLTGVIRHAIADGAGTITLNEINAMMLAFGLISHGSLDAYMGAIERAARGCAGIIVQFPLYAGILAMLSTSGLIERLAIGLTSVSTPQTLPLATFASAAIVNLFVPSGGGQWGVQGPIALQSALDAGVRPSVVIMSVAYGDQLTNMLQPFWALPLLAITGIKARDIVGYTAIVMVAAGLWMVLGLVLFA